MGFLTGSFDIDSIEFTTTSTTSDNWDVFTYPFHNWPYEYSYIPYFEPNYKVLNVKGITIIYTITDNKIRYAVVKRNSEMEFKTTESLEELFKIFM